MIARQLRDKSARREPIAIKNFVIDTIIAFNKERLHSAVLIENFGLSIHGHQFGEIIQGVMT